MSGPVIGGDFAVDAAQALLTGFDTALSKHWREEDRGWREEDRGWRKEDLSWRDEEREWREQEKNLREQNRIWRLEDIEQRHLENARSLWLRFVEKNRRDVEEKSEQLRSVANLSALIAGFAVVSLIELNFDEDATSEVLVALYGTLTAITVALMVNAMVTCNLILAAILKNGKTYVSEDEEEEFIFRCRRHAHYFKLGDRPPYPKRTFQRIWERRFEDSWRTAFQMFSIGVPFFLAMLGVVGWVKFKSIVTAVLISVVMGLGSGYWAQTQYKWARYLLSPESGSTSEATTTDAHLMGFGLPFDWHARPRKGGGTGNATMAGIFSSSAGESEGEGVSDVDIPLEEASHAAVNNKGNGSPPPLEAML